MREEIRTSRPASIGASIRIDARPHADCMPPHALRATSSHGASSALGAARVAEARAPILQSRVTLTHPPAARPRRAIGSGSPLAKSPAVGKRTWSQRTRRCVSQLAARKGRLAPLPRLQIKEPHDTGAGATHRRSTLTQVWFRLSDGLPQRWDSLRAAPQARVLRLYTTPWRGLMQDWKREARASALSQRISGPRPVGDRAAGRGCGSGITGE